MVLQVFSFTDNFDILDGNGAPIFVLKGTHMTLSDRKVRQRIPLHLSFRTGPHCVKDPHAWLQQLRASSVACPHVQVLYSTTGQPVVTLAKKLASLHGTWVAYAGDSKEESTALATIKPKKVTLKPSVDIVLLKFGQEPTLQGALPGVKTHAAPGRALDWVSCCLHFVLQSR